MVTCPVCDGAIDVDELGVDEGDSISCDECGADLKVIGTYPLEFETAEEREEGEDADFVEDAEEEESEEDWKWRHDTSDSRGSGLRASALRFPVDGEKG